MADYFTPTVIQQTILDADMTPLERLLLSHIFESERDNDSWYFFSERGPSDILYVGRAELEAALDASSYAGDSSANSFVAEYLSDMKADGPLPTYIDLDLSTTSWEFIMQDIVMRSSTLSYVTAVSSFTCSRMRPDGFGGAVVLISADQIMGKSTNEILEDHRAGCPLIHVRGGATKCSNVLYVMSASRHGRVRRPARSHSRRPSRPSPAGDRMRQSRRNGPTWPDGGRRRSPHPSRQGRGRSPRPVHLRS